MTYLVAFDGSEGSTTALRRAAALAADTDADLLVVSVLPTDEALAGTYGLIEDGTYDPEAAAERLRAAATEVTADATFRVEDVDAYAGRRRIADRIGSIAREESAEFVFVSGDVGRVVRRVCSHDDDTRDYDVVVVRTP